MIPSMEKYLGGKIMGRINIGVEKNWGI